VTIPSSNGSRNGRPRVVITGIGAVTPIGNDAETTWQNLLAGESGAAPITHFDASDFAVHFACEVKDFRPTDWIDRKQARRMDRFAHLIVAAARQAEQDAGLEIGKEQDRIGASIATGIGGLKAFQDCYDELLQRGPDRVNPFSIPEIIPNMGAAWVSMELGTKGPLNSECTACSAAGPRRRSRASGSRGSGRCARCPGATATPPARADRSTRAVTVS
jgi:3-oxoacyl-[acyl-carrier-protein] synthase II